MSAANRIRDVLKDFGEAYDKANVWEVQGTPVIAHKTLERVAAKAKIRFDLPTIVRAERDEAVIMVVGTRGEQREWSIGECVVNVNYRVSGKQAAYVYAMAEKRAKDRVILKLIELHGFAYSEEEADDFKTAPRDVATQPEPLRSDLIAEEMIEQLAKRSGEQAVSKFLDHPQIKADLGKMERIDFDRVMSVADGRRNEPAARAVA